MEARIQELEVCVAQLTLQRDELYRDIETLCVSDGAAWSGSSVLMQRIVEAERVRDQLKVENKTLKAENQSLLEDMNSIRESKKQSDAYCRELGARFFSFEKSLSEDILCSTDSASEPNDPETLQDNHHKWKEATERVQKLEEELLKLTEASETEIQLEKTQDELALLRYQNQTLEESLSRCRQELEDAVHDARRSEHHVITLLEQLEKSQSEEGKKTKDGKKSRSLQKKLDRLSWDLNRTFAKMKSKEEALSETEAEMDTIKRKYSSEVAMLREAYDRKIQELKKTLGQRDALLCDQQKRIQTMERENRTLKSERDRKEQVLSRMKDGRLRTGVEKACLIEAMIAEHNDTILSYQTKIDGLEAKTRTLETALRQAKIALRCSEQQKSDLHAKALSYKKKLNALKSKEIASDSVILSEANLQIHNFSTEWEEATKPRNGSERRPRSRTGSISSRQGNLWLAQYVLVALLVNSISKS